MKIKCFAAAVLLMLILPFCTGCASALTAEENFNSAGKGAADMQHFTTNTPVRDVMNHPAFKNFGQFLFPTDFYTPSAGMTIAGADSLLPYHTAIKPDTSAAVLNYLLAETENGRQVFYNIYSENARRRNPALQNTGLFFFKGNPGSPFAVICASPSGDEQYAHGFPDWKSSHAFDLASWAIPEPLQKPSKDPAFAYPTGPNFSRRIWPTSPALSFVPEYSLPSSISPAPSPVPNVINTMLSVPLPAP